MLARSFRRILFAEFLIYLALAGALMEFADWTLCQAAATVLGFAAAIRAAGIAVTFVIAMRYASPVPPEHRLGLFGWLKLYFAELAAYVLLYNLYQPFERFFVGADRPLPQGRLPVLLLHGFVCNGGFMLPIKRFLEANGIGACTHDLEPVYADIDTYADAISKRVEAVCAASGTHQLVIVAHSMGGLAARAYLRKFGAGRVAKLLTLGSPHHGTVMAHLGAGENGKQMVPGNAWLEKLNEEAPGLPVVALFSHHDNVVAPQESAMLEGARIVRLSGVGHIAMPFSRRIQEAVLEEVSSAAS